MAGKCTNPHCFVQDGESCMEGEANYLECPNWDVQVDETTPEEVNVSNATRVPWSGSAMGLVDLSNLVPRGRSLMIGVLGAQNSGKTTFLIGNYLQLLKGYRISNSGFSGSRTLGAWESLAAYMRFEDAARNPSFPPHTPRGTSRVPGILHLALRNEKEEFRDVLLTDAPGEWFTRWSSKEDAPEAEGARWVVEHSDVFIIMADCDRLSGDQRGTARRETRELIERLGNHVENRPVILAWAKSDINPSEKIQEAIRRSLNDCIPHAVELNTTTSNHETLLEALSQAVNLAWYPPSVGEVISPVMCSKPYHAFRGHYANT